VRQKLYNTIREALQQLDQFVCDCGHKFSPDESCVRIEDKVGLRLVCPECGETWILEQVVDPN